jgi:outer membrane receptor protein involved in Fe transport
MESVFGIVNPTANHIRDRIEDLVHELQLTGGDQDHVSWLVGAYYQFQDHDGTQRSASPGFDAQSDGLVASFGYPDQLDFMRLESDLRQRAVYGDIAVALTPTVKASVGARWFEFDQHLFLLFDGYLNGGPSTVRESASESGATPRLTLTYRPNEQLMVYASAAEGYRPGGANQFNETTAELCSEDLAMLGFDGPPPPFESDTLWTYELGVKKYWQAQGLVLYGSIYYADWRDMQTFKVLSSCGLGFTENAGKARSTGLELELDWQPAERLDVSFGIAWTDARLTEDVPNVAGEDGESIPTVRKWSTTTSIRHELHARGPVFPYVGLDLQYAGPTWSDFDQAIRVRIPSRRNVNLRSGISGARWSAEIFAENVLDDRAVLVHARNIVGEWQVTSVPRAVGIRLERRF